MIDFYKTIIHHELDRYLETRLVDKTPIIFDDGSSWVVEGDENGFHLVPVTPFNPLAHEDNVGNEAA